MNADVCETRERGEGEKAKSQGLHERKGRRGEEVKAGLPGNMQRQRQCESECFLSDTHSHIPPSGEITPLIQHALSDRQDPPSSPSKDMKRSPLVIQIPGMRAGNRIDNNVTWHRERKTSMSLSPPLWQLTCCHGRRHKVIGSHRRKSVVIGSFVGRWHKCGVKRHIVRCLLLPAPAFHRRMKTLCWNISVFM